MIKKVLLILGGIGVSIWAGMYLNHTIKIKSIEPEIAKGFYPVHLAGSTSGKNSFSDVPLENLLEGKTIIGFGEATHGTDQFREGFKEFAKSLVQQGRANIIIFSERDFSGSWKVNEFVTTENDSSSIGSILPYSSSHQRELILWLKEFNAGKAEEEKVLVFGADSYTPRTAALNAINYCREYQIELPVSTQMFLNDLAFSPSFHPFYLDKYRMEDMIKHLEPLDMNMTRSPREAHNVKESLIVESIRSLQDLVIISSLKMPQRLSSGLRDSLMFRNVKWATAQKAEPKVLIFGHNSHLEKVESNTLSANNGRLGWMLNRHYNEKYYVIASEAGKGTYRAKNDAVYNIPQSMYKIGSIIAKSASGSTGFVDIHASPQLEHFFNKSHYVTFGNLDTGAPTYPTVENFANAHDAIFWIRESSPMPVSNSNGYTFLKSYSAKTDPGLFNANKLNIAVQMTFDRGSSERYYYNSPAIGVIYFSNTKPIDYHVDEFPLYSKTFSVSNALKPDVDSLVIFIAGDNTKKFSLGNIRLNRSHNLNPANLLYTAPSYVLHQTEGMSFSLREGIN